MISSPLQQRAQHVVQTRSFDSCAGKVRDQRAAPETFVVKALTNPISVIRQPDELTEVVSQTLTSTLLTHQCVIWNAGRVKTFTFGANLRG